MEEVYVYVVAKGAQTPMTHNWLYDCILTHTKRQQQQQQRQKWREFFLWLSYRMDNASFAGSNIARAKIPPIKLGMISLLLLHHLPYMCTYYIMDFRIIQICILHIIFIVILFYI